MLISLLLELYCCFLACYNIIASSPTLRSSTLRKFTAVSLAVTILLLLPLVLEILLLLPLYCYCFAADAASPRNLTAAAAAARKLNIASSAWNLLLLLLTKKCNAAAFAWKLLHLVLTTTASARISTVSTSAQLIGRKLVLPFCCVSLWVPKNTSMLVEVLW